MLWRSLDPKALMEVLATAVGRQAKAPVSAPPKPSSVVPAEDAVA